MRFRVGLACGLAAGYWFGTRAGRERHEQLRRAVGLASRGVRRVTTTAERFGAVARGGSGSRGHERATARGAGDASRVR